MRCRTVGPAAAGAATLFGACLSLLAAPPDRQPAGQAPAPAASAPQVPQGGVQSGQTSGRAGRGVAAAPAADDPANADADLSPKPPVLALPAAEQAKRFWLPPGYRLEPVLSDPEIDSPAQIAFDGNGRMFVAELRGYVQTIDGVDSISPVGRISLHADRNNDGSFEHHSTFVDS